MDLRKRLLELGMQGFECSQIMVILAMELEGEENPDLVRAMSGLTGGLGHSGSVCGVLTGGCCVLGLFTGKGEPEEMDHNKKQEIIKAYISWFEDTFQDMYGGIQCNDVIANDFTKCMTTCVPIIEQSMEKIIDLLAEYEILE